MTPADGQQILAENFAHWVQELGLRVERTGENEATLRLPFDARLVRVGGTICGQALMAAADTAMVIAISSALGGFRPMATVSQNVSFFRPVANRDVLVTARVLKLGKTLAFGEIAMRADAGAEPAAHATTTYAIQS
ncbi:MAG: PaaI family thioesterase [Burkholderiales bacterium]|jgi:uncharacterized protein (TIGR00369 family)|nr:PaaI family thioesterase [Burkholderiales bacterium]